MPVRRQQEHLSSTAPSAGPHQAAATRAGTGRQRPAVTGLGNGGSSFGVRAGREAHAARTRSRLEGNRGLVTITQMQPIAALFTVSQDELPEVLADYLRERGEKPKP